MTGCRAAIGLIEHPGENEALLELLLDFSPVAGLAAG